MKPETQNRIAAFYKNEVERIITPPLPGFLTEAPASAVGAPASSICIQTTPDTETSSQGDTRGSKGASHTFRRRLASELVRVALTAAIVSGGMLLPANHSINPVSQGVDRLFTDSGLQNSVSKNLLDAALMIGKSIAKE